MSDPNIEIDDIRPSYADTTRPGRLYKSVASTPMADEQQLYYKLIEYYPKISKQDLDKQYIIRYFARVANQSSGEIIEISSQLYNTIKFNNLFKTIEMHWKIAGKLDDILGNPNINTPTRLYTGVTTWNTIAIEDAEKELPGIKNKITNPNQFYSGTG